MRESVLGTEERAFGITTGEAKLKPAPQIERPTNAVRALHEVDVGLNHLWLASPGQGLPRLESARQPVEAFVHTIC